jgi:hypothetical protein
VCLGKVGNKKVENLGIPPIYGKVQLLFLGLPAANLSGRMYKIHTRQKSSQHASCRKNYSVGQQKRNLVPLKMKFDVDGVSKSCRPTCPTVAARFFEACLSSQRAILVKFFPMSQFLTLTVSHEDFCSFIHPLQTLKPYVKQTSTAWHLPELSTTHLPGLPSRLPGSIRGPSAGMRGDVGFRSTL